MPSTKEKDAEPQATAGAVTGTMMSAAPMLVFVLFALLIASIVTSFVLANSRNQALNATAPDEVSNIEVVQQGDYIRILTWDASPGATSYSVTATCIGHPDDTELNYTQTVTDPTASVNVGDGSVSVISITAVNAHGASLPVTIIVDGSCFVAGTLVRLADGSDKAIEDVRVGDIVLGAFGEHNTVLGLQRPVVGKTRMIAIDDHITTAHHAHVAPDRSFWACDTSMYARGGKGMAGKHFPVLNAAGEIELREFIGFKAGRVIQALVPGTTLLRHSAPYRVSAVQDIALSSDTQLYNLQVGGSHTYTADGFAVTGWPNENDFCYDTWTPRS